MAPNILIIHQDAETLRDKIKPFFSEDTVLLTAKAGFDGLDAAVREKPSVIIVSADLPDLTGYSVATILKDRDEYGSISLVFLTDVIADDILPNTKADYYFPVLSPTNLPILTKQIISSYEGLHTRKALSESVKNAIEYQRKYLPEPIAQDGIIVNHIFAANEYLSGDALNYQVFSGTNNGEEFKYLIGFLIDCEGHDLSAFAQVSNFWSSFYKQIKVYMTANPCALNFADILSDINDDMISLFEQSGLAAAIGFKIDLKNKKLYYASAAIPMFFIKKAGKDLKPVQLESPPLGYEQTSDFKELSIDLSDVSDLIFLTDGISDLLKNPPGLSPEDSELFSAKSDDSTAIFIHFQDV